MRNVAVLTGDLIASTHAGAENVDQAMAVLADASEHIGHWAQQNTRFTRFRGDGWQIYLEFPGLAFRACLYLIARLKASGCNLETRISVGIGAVERLGTADLSDANGDAFIVSGHGLDDMARSRRLAISGVKDMAKFFSGIYVQAEFQAYRWSREQAEAIAIALESEKDPDDPTIEVLARPLGITRQALQARLKGAGYHALTQTLYAFESSDYPIED